MEAKHRLIMTLILGIFLIVGFYLIAGAITKYTGFFVSENIDKEDDFSLCLKEKDITLFINTDNAKETLKNVQLADYRDSIKIKNCLRDNQFCQERGINSFPSWIINGNKVDKDISLDEIKDLSGCGMIGN
jgi:hypothetical protein